MTSELSLRQALTRCVRDHGRIGVTDPDALPDRLMPHLGAGSPLVAAAVDALRHGVVEAVTADDVAARSPVAARLTAGGLSPADAHEVVEAWAAALGRPPAPMPGDDETTVRVDRAVLTDAAGLVPPALAPAPEMDQPTVRVDRATLAAAETARSAPDETTTAAPSEPASAVPSPSPPTTPTRPRRLATTVVAVLAVVLATGLGVATFAAVWLLRDNDPRPSSTASTAPAPAPAPSAATPAAPATAAPTTAVAASTTTVAPTAAQLRSILTTDRTCTENPPDLRLSIAVELDCGPDPWFQQLRVYTSRDDSSYVFVDKTPIALYTTAGTACGRLATDTDGLNRVYIVLDTQPTVGVALFGDPSVADMLNGTTLTIADGQCGGGRLDLARARADMKL